MAELTVAQRIERLYIGDSALVNGVKVKRIDNHEYRVGLLRVVIDDRYTMETVIRAVVRATDKASLSVQKRRDSRRAYQRRYMHSDECACGKPKCRNARQCRACANHGRAVQPACLDCRKRAASAHNSKGLCKACFKQWRQDIVIEYREPGQPRQAA